MEEMVDQLQTVATSENDLVAGIRAVLQASEEPLTPSKIRAALPANLRSLSAEQLGETLQRQAAAQVFQVFPKYRSPQERYWDRPMEDHLKYLLRSVLQQGPFAWSEIRRKLPDYAKTLAESVLEEQAAKGIVYRHPPVQRRSGPRFGLEPPDPKPYLRQDLSALFIRLQGLGFSLDKLRAAALELLHEEEWESTPVPETPKSSEPSPVPDSTEISPTFASTEST